MPRDRSWHVVLFGAGLLSATLWLVAPVRHANDIWWHLASARWMIHTWQFPRVDVFSSTARGNPWIDHEWLYELVLYGFFKGFGINGILFLKVLLIELSLWIQWLRLREREIPFEWRLLAIGLLFWAGRYAWNERADLVSVLGVSFSIWALERDAAGRARWPLYALPVVLGLWANMHGGFVLGLILVGLAAGDAVARRLWTRAWTLAVVGAASIAATVVNPYGWRLHHSIIEGLVQLKTVAISEWQSTPFHPLDVFWAILILYVTLAVRQVLQKRLSVWELGLSLFFAWGAVRYVRNVPYFLVACIPLAVFWLRPDMRRIQASRIARGGLGLLFLISLIVEWPMPKGGLDSRMLPGDACEWIADHPDGPKTFFNDYTFGSYWLWRLAPERPDFIDGRFHMVEGFPDLFNRILHAQHSEPTEWNSFLNSFHVDGALVPYPTVNESNSVLEHYFPSAQWALVYWDDVALIYVRRLPQYRVLIAKTEYLFFRPDESADDLLARSRRSPSSLQRTREEYGRASGRRPYSPRVREVAQALKLTNVPSPS